MVVLPWPFCPISAIRSPSSRRKFSALLARIGEGNVPEFEALPDRSRRRQRVGLGDDRRAHVEKSQQIGKEEGLIGDAGKGRKNEGDVA